MRKSAGIAALAALAAAGLMAAGVAAPATAAPSNKGTTYVVPSEVTGGVLEGVLKPGSLGTMGAAFGIVGNSNSPVIKHVGGLAIDGSAGVLKDSYLELRNFWINTETGFVSGDVENLGRADLFTLSDVELSEGGSKITATLLFTATASAAVGVNVTGQSAGTATVLLK
jgi:hypothetical protein